MILFLRLPLCCPVVDTKRRYRMKYAIEKKFSSEVQCMVKIHLYKFMGVQYFLRITAVIKVVILSDKEITAWLPFYCLFHGRFREINRKVLVELVRDKRVKVVESSLKYSRVVLRKFVSSQHCMFIVNIIGLKGNTRLQKLMLASCLLEIVTTDGRRMPNKHNSSWGFFVHS